MNSHLQVPCFLWLSYSCERTFQIGIVTLYGLTIPPSVRLVFQEEEATHSREDYMEIFCAALQRPGAHAFTQSNAPW